jgi:predicted anti-sigma-YlaC factor YlaD
MTIPTDEHPALARLDAFAAEVPGADGVEAHVARCAACRAYVDETREAAKAFRTEANADAFVARLREEEAKRTPTEVRAEGAADSPKGRLTASASKPRRERSVGKIVGIVVPAVAMAAAIAFLVRGQGGISPSVLPDEPALRFKGKVGVAVVRDRAGDQERLTLEVPVRPGDRIRVEVGVADTRPIVAGVLGKDGSWLALVVPTLLEAGTYLSPKSARFDDAPTEGWIVAGAPDAVERAKVTRVFDDVTAIPIVVEREHD